MCRCYLTNACSENVNRARVSIDRSDVIHGCICYECCYLDLSLDCMSAQVLYQQRLLRQRTLTLVIATILNLPVRESSFQGSDHGWNAKTESQTDFRLLLDLCIRARLLTALIAMRTPTLNGMDHP